MVQYAHEDRSSPEYIWSPGLVLFCILAWASGPRRVRMPWLDDFAETLGGWLGRQKVPQVSIHEREAHFPVFVRWEAENTGRVNTMKTKLELRGNYLQILFCLMHLYQGRMSKTSRRKSSCMYHSSCISRSE